MRNWKTTLAGFLTAVALPVIDYLQKGGTDIKTLALSAGALIIGWFAKDRDVTGTGK